jgi:adenylate kinase
VKLVLLGPPGSGKGTQAAVLCEKLGIPKISTGDMLRAALEAGTKLGLEAKSYMNAGKLVPDEVVIGLVEERLGEGDARNGFILDGFPRTTAQADALGALLQKLDRPLDCVLQIEVPIDLLTERAVLRRTDKRTGQIYHLKYSPPPPDAELEHRADDREETVKKRLDQYESLTAALLPYYDRLGLLRRVDGVGKPE